MITLYKYIKANTREGEELFKVKDNAVTVTKGFELSTNGFRLGMRRRTLPTRRERSGSSLPTVALGSRPVLALWMELDQLK